MIKRLKLWAMARQDARHDRRLGIRTDGYILPADIRDGCFAYLPLGYRSLERLFAQLELRAGHDVFIDFGSGLGRVPIFAAQQPLKRSIGVELSKTLNDVAIVNAKAALPKLACPRVDMIECDARAFEVPADATVFYFFMPFDESILGEVLDNIKASVDAHPRTARIVYVKPLIGAAFIEPVAASRPWLRLAPPMALSRSVQWVRGEIVPAH